VFTIKNRTYKVCFDCGREFDMPSAHAPKRLDPASTARLGTRPHHVRWILRTLARRRHRNLILRMWAILLRRTTLNLSFLFYGLLTSGDLWFAALDS